MYANIWLLIFIVLIGLTLFRLFSVSNEAIRLGLPPKLLSMYILLTILGFVSKTLFIDNNVKGNDIHAMVLVVTMFLFISYATFLFRYEIVGKKFKWFNGLYLRACDSDNVSKIIFITKHNKVIKIRFILENCNQKTMRNDIGADSIVEIFSKRFGIPIKKIVLN